MEVKSVYPCRPAPEHVLVTGLYFIAPAGERHRSRLDGGENDSPQRSRAVLAFDGEIRATRPGLSDDWHVVPAPQRRQERTNAARGGGCRESAVVPGDPSRTK